MFELGVLLLLLGAPGPPQDPAGVEAERSLRAAYSSGLHAADASTRAGAVSAYSEGTRALGAELAASKLVASTLAKALDDDDLQVQSAAVLALAWGRHPETAIAALREVLPGLRNEAENLSTRPDGPSQERRRLASQVYAAACAALGRHADDRAVEALAEELRKIRPQQGPGAVAELHARPLADGLLALGSAPAVELVVKTTGVFSGSTLRDGASLATARQLHTALAAFSERLGHGPPTWTELYDQDWRKWFKAHAAELPVRLGQMQQPAAAPVYVAPGRDRDARQPGRPERP